MSLQEKIRGFLLPSMSKGFVFRLIGVSIAAWIFFGYVCIPLHIQGKSMEPTYHDGGFNFCQSLSYIFGKPQRFDVVGVKLAGNRVMLLKRIVALSGETVEFRNGKLWVNGALLNEPYLQYPCNWSLPPRRVKPDRVYVVGDNRSTAHQGHQFGQAPIQRIVGKILW
jgi:signal peptidase I